MSIFLFMVFTYDDIFFSVGKCKTQVFLLLPSLFPSLLLLYLVLVCQGQHGQQPELAELRRRQLGKISGRALVYGLQI